MDELETSMSRRIQRLPRRGKTAVTIVVCAALMLGLTVTSPPGFAGSNLTVEYPPHRCGDKPEPPKRPQRFRYRAELDEYNANVHAYNAAMEKFIACLQSYVDSAASDIRAIRKNIDAALEAVKP